MSKNYSQRTKTIKVKTLDIPKEKISEYKEAFDLFDKDGSGSISATEIYKIMKNFGNTIPMKQIKEMIDKIDDRYKFILISFCIVEMEN